MTEELKSGILAMIEAYRERWRNPPKPGPLIVPDWLPPAWAEAHPDHPLDGVCRDYGFDGFKTVSESW